MGNLSPKTGNLAASALLGITFICVRVCGGGGGGLSSPSKKKKEKEKKGKRSATANGDPGSFYSAATSTLVGGTEKRAGWSRSVPRRFLPLSPF